MRDIALDPDTGDILLAGGRARLTEEGVESIRQRLTIRLRLWRGEVLTDGTIGVPYATTLGTKAVPYLEAVLRECILTCPGIASLESFRLEVDADREAFVTFDALTVTGEPLSFEEFRTSSAPPSDLQVSA